MSSSSRFDLKRSDPMSFYGALDLIIGNIAIISRLVSSQLVLRTSSFQPLKLILPNLFGCGEEEEDQEGVEMERVAESS